MISHKEAHVLLTYDCPFCDASFTFSPEEIRVTKQVLCYCKKILRFKPITRVDVNVVYTDSPKKENVTQTYNADSTLIDEAVSGLVFLGFKKVTAKKTVEHLIAKTVYKTVENLISDACQVCHTHSNNS